MSSSPELAMNKVIQRKTDVAKRSAAPTSRSRGAAPYPPRIVLSLQRGLHVLAYIVESERPLKLLDIVAKFDLDKASAYRLLSTLTHEGLVAKHPVDKTYVIGGRLLLWMASPRHEQELIQAARPFLENLSRRTRESTHFGILTSTKVSLIDVVPSDNLVAIRHCAGTEVDLHCTAVGKALLAFLPAPLRNRLLTVIDYQRFTAKTIVKPEVLDAELINVREVGYAIDDAEFNDWIYCIAAPVLDGRGVALGAVGVSTFKPVLADDKRRVAMLIAEVKDCAQMLSLDLQQTQIRLSGSGITLPR
jgi:IclR family acetate operon transcriptional repressor